ncbi:MAG: hypothetical protein Rhims3KO_12470 [Hyphomicrobiales bacterium]
MEPTAIASSAMTNAQAQVGAAAGQKMVKMSAEAAQQVVAMLDQAVSNSASIAASQSGGSATAPGVGTRVDKQA